MKKRGRGFTLIELLVVIAIIGVLSAIVFAALGSTRSNAKDAERISDIRQIRYALAIYYNTNSSYPCAIYTGGSCPNTSTLQGAIGSAMPSPPKDPSGTNYSYAALGSGASCTSYHLGASLEDKNHKIITADADAVVGTLCTNSPADFSGLSAATGGSACSATAGTAEPNGTETCYDTTP